MKNVNWTKILGVAVTIGGIIINLASDGLRKREQDALITEKIQDALNNREK